MDALLKKYLGKAARDARRDRGLTQAEVATSARLSKEVYGRIERGEMMPSVPTMQRLCHVLEVDANTLLGFSSPTPPAWFSAPTVKVRPTVERILRTARRLKPQQLSALKGVALAMSTVEAGPLKRPKH